jgi:3'(2'), 5'-bisphosphate nucleotidase
MPTRFVLDSTFVETLASIAERAGEKILEIYRANNPDAHVSFASGASAPTNKDDGSPLTVADLAANELIVRELTLHFPDIPILTEEAVWHLGQANRYFAVDPLDGTKEFIKRNGEFTVNIALVEGGTPIAGVVHAPVLQQTWSGLCSGVGSEARKREIGKPWRAIRVAEKKQEHSDSDRIKMVGSRSHANSNLPHWLENLLGNYELVECGSSLKFCLVAEGLAHVYPRFGPTCIWDTAAGHAVVSAAGGRVVNAETLETLSYPDPSQALNPNFVVLTEFLLG